MAYTTYLAAWEKGDDGTKSDYFARKSCNYITETIEDCSNILTDCMDEEQMHRYKDEQYKNALGNIEATIENWDSKKCPAAQRHIDRLNAAEAEKDTDEDKTAEEIKDAEDNSAAEQDQLKEEEESAASATSLAVSIVF